MDFAEDLPENCPPNGAEDCGVPEAWRLVERETPLPADFLSHAALSKPNYGRCPCQWASCSMFLSLEKAKAMLKFPKLRASKSHAAKLEISEGFGQHVIADSDHVDFWAYAGTNLASCVVSVEGLQP